MKIDAFLVVVLGTRLGDSLLHPFTWNQALHHDELFQNLRHRVINDLLIDTLLTLLRNCLHHPHDVRHILPHGKVDNLLHDDLRHGNVDKLNGARRHRLEDFPTPCVVGKTTCCFMVLHQLVDSLHDLRRENVDNLLHDDLKHEIFVKLNGPRLHMLQ